MTREQQIRDFRTYLEQLGYSKSSCQMLPACVKDFLRQAGEPQAISGERLRQFYEWLQERPHKKREGGLSEQYISHHIYALRVYFNWQEQTGQISYNPISVMKFKRPQANPREPLSIEEIKELFEAARTARETAILHIFYSCGLRRGEGEALNRSDIHFKQQLLYVRSGKGAKRRAVPMTERVAAALENYYYQERRAGVNPTEAYLLNKAGDRMRGEAYAQTFKELLGRTGIRRAVSLHHLRHSIATHLLERGLSIEYVRDFLGHAFLESTQIYAKVHQRQLLKL